MTTSPNLDPTTQSDPAGADRRALLAGLGLLTAGALLTRKAQAGPLDPPAGPVTSTGKPLDQIEPRTPLPLPDSGFTINAPGSYYLTGNLTDQSIVINASHVSLDLAGFVITMTSNTSAIIVPSERRRHLSIRNGSVRCLVSSGQAPGIDLAAPGSAANENSLVEDLSVEGFGGGQINAYSGDFALWVRGLTVRRCRLTSVVNNSAALLVGSESLVEQCELNSASGALLGGANNTIRRCSLHVANSGAAVFEDRVLIEDCHFTLNNTAFGLWILSGSASKVRGCTFANAAGFAILAENCNNTTISDCTIEGVIATAFQPGYGIRVAERARIERCKISRCVAQGLVVSGFDATILDCSFTENATWGIECIGPAMIDRCHIANSGLGAISVDQLVRISNCHLDFNSSFGIRTTSGSPSAGGTDIVDCTITRHTLAIRLESPSGSAVRRCMFFGNDTNISAPAGNYQLISAGAGLLTATNPHANIVI